MGPQGVPTGSHGGGPMGSQGGPLETHWALGTHWPLWTWAFRVGALWSACKFYIIVLVKKRCNAGIKRYYYYYY